MAPLPEPSHGKGTADVSSSVSSLKEGEDRFKDEDDSASLSSSSTSQFAEEEEEEEFNDESGSDMNDSSGHVSSNGSGVEMNKKSSATTQRDTEVKQVQKMSLRETIGVRFWRLVVLVLLVVAGIVVSTTTYNFLIKTESAEFMNRYNMFSNTIEDACQFHITNMHQAVTALSETVTASALLTNASFPFITVPVFEMHGEHARTQSGIETISFNPLIADVYVAEWNNYSVEHQGWIQESRALYQSNLNDNEKKGGSSFNATAERVANEYVNGSIYPYIYNTDREGNPYPPSPPGPYMPFWQMSPPPFDPTFVNQNLLQEPYLKALVPPISLTREGLFSFVFDLTTIANTGMSAQDHSQFHIDNGASDPDATVNDYFLHPHSVLAQPVFEELGNSQSDIVGLITSIVPWDRYLTNLLPVGVKGIMCVLRNTCGQAYSYALDGNAAIYLGEGDFHDASYNTTEKQIPLRMYIDPRTSSVGGHCEYTLYVYATTEYRQDTTSAIPVVFTTIVALTFLVVVVTFIVYDIFVQKRNSKVVHAAARSNAILSSLFPSNVRDRLIAETEAQDKAVAQKKSSNTHTQAAKSRLRNFLDSDGNPEHAAAGGDEKLGYEGKPIADLFPETSVMFADIAGFTAWSSVREPAQVFTLLETLYRAFDEIAKRRRVFKVETVGDCYVAVTGLPDPMKDHAVALSRFARDCMIRCRVLTKKLETTLGPDTGDLEMRMGIHSGQVTGGVLRGERSRFQLFGDTMNTASRMESTSIRGRIQISQDTADLLIAAGKSEWVSLREEKIVAKGKGEMQTYWLSVGESRSGEATSVQDSASQSAGSKGEDENIVADTTKDEKVAAMADSRTTRLIEWNVDVLLRLLKQIVARRRAMVALNGQVSCRANETQFELYHAESGKTAIDEVKEIITLPQFDPTVAAQQEDPDSISLPTDVVDQLYDYVSNIAAIYNENPFHNFEHASHVTMSVVKLLSRIVAPNEVDYDEDNVKTGQSLHDHTYGITSDPLTQFACVFSALIHDADHSGVPNVQLVKERSHIAEFYKGKSVAEQNSVDLAWHLLMDDAYNELRATIYQTDAELKRFRQLVVNSVMATDIVDKELKTLRNERWAKAFSDEAATDASRDAINRKATIVIEHLIQASDIAHTMQHWHIYRKWNERFFLECYKAYKDGRAETDPSIGWYKGEIGFYDFYIIPLAKKLKDCGVFGVSSDEYLNYAVRNRKEWEERGMEVVNEMVELVQKKYGKPENKRSTEIMPDVANPSKVQSLQEQAPALSMVGSSKRFSTPRRDSANE